MKNKVVLGPFSQIVTMDKLSLEGPLNDNSLEIVPNGGIIIKNGYILDILNAEELEKIMDSNFSDQNEMEIVKIDQPLVLIPGFIDSHTHICYAGNRADEYGMKLAGISYLEIAKQGGGIMNTVKATRNASLDELIQLTIKRAKKAAKNGVTTCEVKSGYGLSMEAELKMLRAINMANKETKSPELIPTCLAAHIKPPEFELHKEYLDEISQNLLPKILKEKLSKRIDIFIEEDAFDGEIAKKYLESAKSMGFDIVVHADQFSIGGSQIAAEVGAISADHLEAANEKNLNELKGKHIIATVLPGSSIGLGITFAPARKILDLGLSMVIASDWNPGSAPMGDLLTQAAILGAYQKLSICETLAAITFRAANALNLADRGILKKNLRADMIAFPCDKYTEIFYAQGSLKPKFVWKNGLLIVGSEENLKISLK